MSAISSSLNMSLSERAGMCLGTFFAYSPGNLVKKGVVNTGKAGINMLTGEVGKKATGIIAEKASQLLRYASKSTASAATETTKKTIQAAKNSLQREILLLWINFPKQAK